MLTPRFTCVHDSVYFVSPQLSGAGWISSITSYIYRLTFALLVSGLCTDKISLHIDLSTFSFLPSCFCRGGEPPCSRCECSSSGTTSAHTRIEPHSPRLHPPAIMWISPASPPSLPSSLLPSLCLSSSSCRPAWISLNPHNNEPWGAKGGAASPYHIIHYMYCIEQFYLSYDRPKYWLLVSSDQ